MLLPQCSGRPYNCRDRQTACPDFPGRFPALWMFRLWDLSGEALQLLDPAFHFSLPIMFQNVDDPIVGTSGHQDFSAVF